MSKYRICMIIPYFGKKPDYFDLWALSVSKNPDIDFFYFTDIEIESKYKNLKIIKTTFEEIRQLFKDKIKFPIKLESLYKLCDYKPTYGYVFSDVVENYDFWGYCDVDLIFGNISNFVTNEKLDKFDKLYYHGHFTLFRNNKELNELFLRESDKFIDYRYAFKTNCTCHFDESGLPAFSKKFNIATYESNDFLDVYPAKYRFTNIINEYVKWDDGILFYSNLENTIKKELLYIHLQKRKMNNYVENYTNFYIGYEAFSNDFCVYDDNEKAYLRKWRKIRFKQLIYDIRNGHLKFKFDILLKKWERR